MTALRKVSVPEPEGAEQRVVIHGVSWDSYERMLEEFNRHPSTRLTYEEGTLEIMVVSLGHEKLRKLLEMIVEIVAWRCHIDFVAAGSTTFKLKKKDRGFEPDGCYYFTNVRQMARKERIDLTKDPVPDLAIEVDISSPSLSRFPIFARLGVAEVWRYHEDRLEIFHLRGAMYVKRESSHFLPGVTARTVTTLVREAKRLKAPEWQDKVQQYAEKLKQSE